MKSFTCIFFKATVKPFMCLLIILVFFVFFFFFNDCGLAVIVTFASDFFIFPDRMSSQIV